MAVKQVGTVVFYNGILFSDCKTEQFAQVIKYDEANDVEYSTFQISIESSVLSLPDDAGVDNLGATREKQHPSSVHIAIDPSGGVKEMFTGPANLSIDRVEIVRSRLQESKKDFWMAIHTGDSNPPATPTDYVENPTSGYRYLLAATGEYGQSVDHNYATGSIPEFLYDFGFTGSTRKKTKLKRVDWIDVNEGPIAKGIDVQLIGGRYIRARVTFEITLYRYRQEDSGLIPPAPDVRKVRGVISNKWSVQEGLSPDWKTSHTIQGLLRIKDHRWKAQAMRTMVHPSLFPYAKLEGRQFVTDEGGLTLQYTFNIKETGAAPPPGLIDWDAKYIESAGMAAAMQVGIMDISVKGAQKLPTGVTRQQQTMVMIRAMFHILRSRLPSVNKDWQPLPGVNTATSVLRNIVITEDLKSPNMSLRAEVLHGPPKDSTDDKAAIRQFHLRLKNMGTPLNFPSYDPKYWPVPDFFQWDTISENARAVGADGQDGSYLHPYEQRSHLLWKSLPRRAKTNKISLASAHVGEEADAVPDAKPNNQGSEVFTTYVVPAIDGSDRPIEELPPLPAASIGFDSAYRDTGFTYLNWSSFTRYDGSTGNVVLPLSTPRIRPNAVYSSGEPLSVHKATQTCVVTRLHAGTSQRVFRMKASRRGDWPQTPAMRIKVVDDIAIGGTGIEEHLIHFKTISETPKLDRDGVTIIYEVEFEALYAQDRTPGMLEYESPSSAQAYRTSEGYSEARRVGHNPMARMTSGNNALNIGKYWTVGVFVDGSTANIDGMPATPGETIG